MRKVISSRSALATLGLGLVLLLPQTSSAQWFGLRLGGRYGGVSIGSWGGYRGLGYGGFYSPYRYGSWGYPGYSYYRPYYSGSYSYGLPYLSYYSPRYYSYSIPSYTYTTPGYAYAAPAYAGYATPQYSSSGPNPSYQSFYSPAGSASQAAPAHVQVHVPNPKAEVYFDGTKTQQHGTEREFVSPPLKLGRDYTYKIRVQWMENGQRRDQTRTVQVHPGQETTVDFTRPDGGVGPRTDVLSPQNATGGKPSPTPAVAPPVDRNPTNPAPQPGTTNPPPARRDNPPNPPRAVNPPPGDE